MIFQQGGAPPHFRREIRAYLNTLFPGKWIGHVGTAARPLCSPDWVPLDVSLWEFMMDVVYVPPIPTHLLDFLQRITHVVCEVDQDTMLRIWEELTIVGTIPRPRNL
jgi:hypothetical protein